MTKFAKSEKIVKVKNSFKIAPAVNKPAASVATGEKAKRSAARKRRRAALLPDLRGALVRRRRGPGEGEDEAVESGEDAFRNEKEEAFDAEEGAHVCEGGFCEEDDHKEDQTRLIRRCWLAWGSCIDHACFYS